MADKSNIFPPIKVAGGFFIIKCVDYLDASNSQEFDKTLTKCINDGNVRIVLDFSDLDYISSAGANVVIGSLERVRTSGGDMVILQPKEGVQDVIDLLGLSTLLHIALNPATAARYFLDIADPNAEEQSAAEEIILKDTVKPGPSDSDLELVIPMEDLEEDLEEVSDDDEPGNAGDDSEK